MRKIICVLWIILASSCAKEETTIPTINLAEGTAVDINPDFLLNDIVDGVTFTQLESKDSLFHTNLFLHSINDKGDYCFSDRGGGVNNTVFIYDKEGKLISHFNRTGRGQGEFLDINSLFYDGDDAIEVLCSDNNTVYQYNRKGEYKSKFPIKNSIAIRPIGSGKYFSLMRIGKEESILEQARIVDGQGNMLDRFYPADTTQMRGVIYIATDIYVTKCAEQYCFYFSTPEGNLIYSNYNIENNRVSEICEFDVGEMGMTAKALLDGIRAERFILMINPFKVNNYVIVQFVNRGVICLDVWDLRTCKIVARRAVEGKSKGKLGYKLPNGDILEIQYTSFTSHNDQLIVTCSPMSLAGKIPETIDPEGNDVIVTFKLKK